MSVCRAPLMRGAADARKSCGKHLVGGVDDSRGVVGEVHMCGSVFPTIHCPLKLPSAHVVHADGIIITGRDQQVLPKVEVQAVDACVALLYVHQELRPTMCAISSFLQEITHTARVAHKPLHTFEKNVCLLHTQKRAYV